MPEAESSSSVSLASVVGILVRQGFWIVLIASGVALATVAAVYHIRNRYTSEATLFVVPQQVPARYVTPTSETNIVDALQAITQDVLSRARLLSLIDEFGLFAKERKHLAPEELIALMRGYIEIQPLDPTPGHKESNAFKISFTAEKAALAQQVTSKLTSFFIQANLKTREDQAANTTNFLRDQLETAKAKLTAQEERVRDFKTQYLGELPEQQQGNLAIFNGAQLQLQNLDTSLDRARQQRVYLESLLSGYRSLSARGTPVPGVPGSDTPRFASPLQVAQNDLARLQTEKGKLLIVDKPAHPDVIAIEREIAAKQAVVESLRASVNTQATDAHLPPGTPPATAEASQDDSSITQLKSQLEANRLEIENLMKYEEQQKAIISEYQNRLNLTPVREQQLTSLLRDYELSKQDYADLLGKEQQSQLAASLEKQQGGQQFRLVEPPSLPALPSSPKRTKLSLGGLGAGLVLGLAFALLKELARPTFHTTKEISQRFAAPLVIGLPEILTRAELRNRRWIKGLELVCGSALAVAICVAEYYVLRHP